MYGLPHLGLSVYLVRNTSIHVWRVSTIELVNHYTLSSRGLPWPVVSVQRIRRGCRPGKRAREVLNQFWIWCRDGNGCRRSSDNGPRGFSSRRRSGWWRSWVLSNFLPVTFVTLKFGRCLNRAKSIAILGQGGGCKRSMAPTYLVSGIMSNVTIG
jgi:hypothetical protein